MSRANKRKLVANDETVQGAQISPDSPDSPDSLDSLDSLRD